MDTKTLKDLLDQQNIRDVLSKYCELLDENKLDEVVQLFSADCVTDYGPGRGGPGVGPEVLRKRFQNNLTGFLRTHHQLGQIRISLDGDKATSVAYVIADHELRNGKRETVRMQYWDRLVCTNGRWRIAYRETRATIVDGEVRIERVMLPRNEATSTLANAAP